MKCRICAGEMEERMTDLPFKIGDVFQRRQCGEVELGSLPTSKVIRILAAVDRSAELEVVRYAA